MRIIQTTLLAICINIVFTVNAFASSTIIHVDSIFSNITQIREVKVLFYTGDTIVTLLDLSQGDTFELDCRDEKLRYDSLLAAFDIQQNDTFIYNDKRQRSNNYYTEFDNGTICYKLWEGTYPRNGELITMINFNYKGDRILFGRKKGDHIRFWSPRLNQFFFTNIYVFEKDGLYQPLPRCEAKGEGHYPVNTDLEFRCSDGFIVSQTDFNRIKKEH